MVGIARFLDVLSIGTLTGVAFAGITGANGHQMSQVIEVLLVQVVEIQIGVVFQNVLYFFFVQ